MYNRYIPQADGSYRRSPVPDSRPAPRQSPPEPPPAPEPPCREELKAQVPPCRSGQSCPGRRPVPRSAPPKPPESTGVGNFLRQLLPRDFDTEDLVIVLLLLLMSGENREDQNTALLTLALYLFL